MRYVRQSYTAMTIVAVFLAAFGVPWRGTAPYPIALFAFATMVYCIPVTLFAITVETIAHFHRRAKK